MKGGEGDLSCPARGGKGREGDTVLTRGREGRRRVPCSGLVVIFLRVPFLSILP